MLYLAAAGIGKLTVIDDDVISLSNLQRQVIYTTDEVGKQKTVSAKAAIERLNPHVKVEAIASRFVVANAMELVSAHDIVVDGSDNFATRYLVSDACYFAARPLVTAALGTFDGTLTTIRAHEKSASGEPNPTYRCLFPEAPPAGIIPTCEQAGIIGALAGAIGSLAAIETVRAVVGFGDGLIGKLLMFDVRDMRIETLRYAWNPDNPLSGKHPTIRDLSVHSR
jgi:adenylyltransferase/sulfurtransferase